MINYNKFELCRKLNKYIKKYNNLIFISLKLLFHSFIKTINIPSFYNKHKIKPLQKGYLSIGIRFEGGLGDNLVYMLWVKEFSKLLNYPFLIDVFPNKSDEISNALVKKQTFVNNIYNYSEFDNNFKKYDIAILFRRFPYFINFNTRKIKNLVPELLPFIKEYSEFADNNQKFFTFSASCDTQVDLYSICKGEKRIQQPDINNLLGIEENKTKLYCPLNSDYFDILKKTGLEDKKYITITRSVELSQHHKKNIRLWDIKYYTELVKLLKLKYPNILIVQLGVPRCEKIEGVDIDLLGKTNLEELKIILKYSLLHIDGECGMVHLKHFLYGKSAVFFGQTAIEYLGYDNNINLKSNGCSHWCEWIVDDWQTHCIRGYEEAPCMTELKPDYVFENIVPYLDSVVNKSEKQIAIQEVEDLKTYFENNIPSNKKIIFYGKEFYEIAKTLIHNNNQITIYDEKLDNKTIKEAKNLGILMDYGDIYNIPEENNSCDLFVLFSDKFRNDKFILKETQRISPNILIINNTIWKESK